MTSVKADMMSLSENRN